MKLLDFAKVVGATIGFSGTIDPTGKHQYVNVYMEKEFKRLHVKENNIFGYSPYGRDESSPPDIDRAGERFVEKIRGQTIRFGDIDTYEVPQDIDWK